MEHAPGPCGLKQLRTAVHELQPAWQLCIHRPGNNLCRAGFTRTSDGVFASSGAATFDGAGHLTLTAISSFNGAVQTQATVTGTYSVNSDCSYTSQTSNGATFRGIIVDGGWELFILQTNSGTAIAGTAWQRGRASLGLEAEISRPFRCGVADITGSYGFIAEGFAGAPTLPGAPFGPLAGVGLITLNPGGSYTMMAQRSVNGTLDPQPLPLSGTFSVSPDCTAKLTFDVGFHFEANIISSNEAVFIETDPGTAVIVKSKRL